MSMTLSIALLAGLTPGQSALAHFRENGAYAARMARTLPKGRMITQHLSTLKNTRYVKISYVDAQGTRHHPVTAKTLVKTSPSGPEAGVDHIGWAAQAQIGDYPAFFYRSNSAYHSRWFKNWMAGNSASNTTDQFNQLKLGGPCVGVSIGIDEFLSAYSSKDFAGYLTKELGQPTSRYGQPASTNESIGNFSWEWVKKDRVVVLLGNDDASLVLNIVFRP